jgi:hypothetical protein
MQDNGDCGTTDLFGFRPAGRPKQTHTLSGAQRQARYRNAELKRAEARQSRLSHLSSITLARYMSDPDQEEDARKDMWLEFGRRFGFK